VSATEASPAAQRLLTDARGRIPAAPVGRERRTEVAMGGSFALAALALAILVPTGAELSWPDALAATALLALAGCVIFEVGSFHTAPLQIAFVPLLFLVPPELAPLFVALALAASRAAQAIAGELAPQRIGLALGDAWFAIGPALVLALADADPIRGRCCAVARRVRRPGRG